MMNNIELYINKNKIKIKKSIECGNYNRALQLLSACSNILYVWNQTYCDKDLEDYMKMLKVRMQGEFKEQCNVEQKENRILFYDEFGMDYRGLARIYLRALIQNGYHVIYVTRSNCRNTMAGLLEELNEGSYECIFIDDKCNVQTVKALYNIILSSGVKDAFLYTIPQDTCGILAFMLVENHVTRYQIDLTDHAYWLGVNAFDKCIEFRSAGASIAVNKRKILKDKVVMIPFYPIVDDSQKFMGFPFEKKKQKVLFSGGALYKTFGEGDGYYKLVDKILMKNENVIFWYVGFGDASKLERLQKKYPQRCYYTSERKDLCALLKNCDAFLNTYPQGGGLMMQYAAMAGLKPMTLYDNLYDTSGILLNDSKLNIYFNKVDDLVSEISKILSGEIEQNDEWLKSSVVTEKEFQDAVKQLIEAKKTNYVIDFTEINTDVFIQTYAENYTNEQAWEYIAQKKFIGLILDFPKAFLIKIRKKCIDLTRRKNASN